MSPEVISMREPDEPTTSERFILSSGRYVLFGPFQIDQQRHFGSVPIDTSAVFLDALTQGIEIERL